MYPAKGHMSRAKTAQLLDTADTQGALRAGASAMTLLRQTRTPSGCRPRAGGAARRRAPRWVVLLLACLAVGGPADKEARAGEAEPLLFLGIQRSTTIDKLASQIIVEQLQDRGETLLPTTGLSDTDRRCRRLQCLNPLAAQRKAALVLDGDVQQVGQNRSLRIVMHLYDSRKRQQHEQENLCVDCDETKLGILLANTTTDLLVQYRKMDAAMDQLAALLDAAPVASQDRSAPPSKSPDGSPGLPTLPAAPPLPGQSQPAGEQRPLGSPSQSTDPGRVNPAGFLNETTQQGPVTPALPPPPIAPYALPAAPAPYALPPGASVLPPGGPAAYPTPMPPLPLVDSTPVRRGPGTRRLSAKRKIIAGVLGGLGAGALIAAVTLNALDYRLAANRSYNPDGSPCSDPQYAGQNCVLSTIRLWAPGYGLGGLLLGSMILTLTIPER